MKRTGRKGIRKKPFFIAIACVCLIAIAAEGLLLAGVFSGKKKAEKKEQSITVTPTGTVPEPTGMEPSPTPDPEEIVRVWRETERTIETGNLSYKLERQEYDASGRLTHSILYRDGDTIQQETFFTYDEAGRMIGKEQRTINLASSVKDAMYITVETRTYFDNGDLKSVEVTPPEFDADNASLTEYTYDAGHHVLTQTVYMGRTKSLSARMEYGYDEAGNMISYRKTDADNISVWNEEHTYDSEGRRIRMIGGEKPGVTESATEYTYDGAGNLISETYLFEDQKGISYSYLHTYDYDNAGNMIRKKETGASSVSSSSNYEYTYEYAYDGRGNKTREKQYYMDGSILYDCEYEYDENDVLKKEIQKNPDGSVSSTITYQYQAFDVPKKDLTEKERDWLERRAGR